MSEPTGEDEAFADGTPEDAPPARAVFEGENSGRATVRFEKPLRAVTPGQAVVIYRGRRVVGGGTIKRAIK